MSNTTVEYELWAIDDEDSDSVDFCASADSKGKIERYVMTMIEPGEKYRITEVTRKVIYEFS